MTVQEAAEALHLDISYIHYLINHGKLTATRERAGRSPTGAYDVDEESVEVWRQRESMADVDCLSCRGRAAGYECDGCPNDEPADEWPAMGVKLAAKIMQS